jgi:hypothetical protein
MYTEKKARKRLYWKRNSFALKLLVLYDYTGPDELRNLSFQESCVIDLNWDQND